MSAALASKAPSLPPPCCRHDHSDGVRAYVTIHAIRRYGDRILGLEEALADLDDIEAVDAMVGMRVEVPASRPSPWRRTTSSPSPMAPSA